MQRLQVTAHFLRDDGSRFTVEADDLVEVGHPDGQPLFGLPPSVGQGDLAVAGVTLIVRRLLADPVPVLGRGWRIFQIDIRQPFRPAIVTVEAAADPPTVVDEKE